MASGAPTSVRRKKRRDAPSGAKVDGGAAVANGANGEASEAGGASGETHAPRPRRRKQKRRPNADERTGSRSLSGTSEQAATAKALEARLAQALADDGTTIAKPVSQAQPAVRQKHGHGHGGSKSSSSGERRKRRPKSSSVTFSEAAMVV